MGNSQLFDILNAIDDVDPSKYEELSDDYNPFMTMKWLASCKDPARIIRVNELLNVVTFTLHAHPQLLFNLSCALSDGRRQRYNWIKRYKDTRKKQIEIMASYFDITPREARTSIFLYTDDDILEMAEELGYTEQEIKKLKKHIDAT